MLRIPFQSTIFSVVFLAFFLANVYLLQTMTLGIILLIVFLVVSADHLGTTVASQEHGPLRWVMGCLLLISGLMLILTVAYYVAFIPKELVIILIVLTGPTLTILHKHYGGTHFLDRFHQLWKEHAHRLSRPLLFSAGGILLLSTYLLSAYQRLAIFDA